MTEDNLHTKVDLENGSPAFAKPVLGVVPSTKALSIVGSSRNNGERESEDFYPTPPYAVEELLKREVFSGNIWECACGEGDISEVFKNKVPFFVLLCTFFPEHIVTGKQIGRASCRERV